MATLLENDLRPRLQSLQARLARDGIVTTLPPPTTVSILLDICMCRKLRFGHIGGAGRRPGHAIRYVRSGELGA
jgi:hypothetical protein